MKATRYTKETILDIGVIKRPFADFSVGDTIAIDQKVEATRDKKGKKESDEEKGSRIQTFEGDVLAFHKNGVASTITVRRMGVHGVSIELILPYFSPRIEAIRLVRKGIVRRARLYYVRDRIGKAARIEERVVSGVSAAARSKTAAPSAAR